MKKLLLLLSVLFIVSCSKDDDATQAAKKEGNFLEVYNGVVWKHTDSENSEDNAWYVFSPKSMIDYEIESTCVKSTYIWGLQNAEGLTKTVLENSKNLLKLEIKFGSISGIGTITVSENGNVITASSTLDAETETWNKVSEHCK